MLLNYVHRIQCLWCLDPNHPKSSKISTVGNWYFHLFKWGKITTWQEVQGISVKFIWMINESAPWRILEDSGRFRARILYLVGFNTSHVNFDGIVLEISFFVTTLLFYFRKGYNKYLKLIKFLPYTDVCIALHTQCFPSVCEKTWHVTQAGFETHNVLLTRAEVLTSRPPSFKQI